MTCISPQPPLHAKKEKSGGSTSAAQFAYVDPNLNWDDIAWIRKLAPGRSIVLKGIGCVEDAILAHEHGCEGIVLSNHGGRQLDGARPPIEVLQEIRKERPDLCDKMEIFVDGGIRRGTDVLKALCLGAKAVGIGRPFLYAQSAYGPDGVVKVVDSECNLVELCEHQHSLTFRSLVTDSLEGRNGDEYASIGRHIFGPTRTFITRLSSQIATPAICIPVPMVVWSLWIVYSCIKSDFWLSSLARSRLLFASFGDYYDIYLTKQATDTIHTTIYNAPLTPSTHCFSHTIMFARSISRTAQASVRVSSRRPASSRW